MTIKSRTLARMPATVSELAALEGTTVRRMNAHLCLLRQRGLARRTDRVGLRYGQGGPRPAIWERVDA